MRVKTVPRHRILQSNVEVMSATKTSINNESLMDIKNEHDPKYNTINVQSPYQVYTYKHTQLFITFLFEYYSIDISCIIDIFCSGMTYTINKNVERNVTML